MSRAVMIRRPQTDYTRLLASDATKKEGGKEEEEEGAEAAPAAVNAPSAPERPPPAPLIHLFRMTSPEEAPFLVGAKGRNIALVRKYSGMNLTIQGEDVFAAPYNNSARASLVTARQLGLSACAGGILRWFVTPKATREGYPDRLVPGLKALADMYNCDLDALRSNRGHVCLMLVPRLTPPVSARILSAAPPIAKKEDDKVQDDAKQGEDDAKKDAFVHGSSSTTAEVVADPAGGAQSEEPLQEDAQLRTAVRAARAALIPVLYNITAEGGATGAAVVTHAGAPQS